MQLQKILLLSLFLITSSFYVEKLLATDVSFLIQEGNTLLYKEGNSDLHYPAYSSLKIAISVMGYDAGILNNAISPSVMCEGADHWYYAWLFAIFKQIYNPTTWMSHEHMSYALSAAWYSEWILQQLGIKKIEHYLLSFQYGDSKNLTYVEEKDGPLFLWLKKSLMISTREQISFLQKLLLCQLPASPRAQKMTQKILYMDKLSEGWKLYGKSCSGPHGTCLGPHGTWFVGWVEKNDRHIIFAYHAFDSDYSLFPATTCAKEAVKEKLQMMIFSRR